MKQVVVLGSRHFGTKNDPTIVADALRRSGKTEVHLVFFEDIVMNIATGDVHVAELRTGYDLRHADLVVAFSWYKPDLRDIAYATALYLQHHGVPVWNTEVLHQRSTTKLSTTMLLALNNLPVPRTIFCLSHHRLPELVGQLGWPCVVKAVAASRGHHNHLVQNGDELLQRINLQPAMAYIAQEFIPNTHDWRILCMGGEPRAAIERARSSDTTHLNNTSQGGKATVRELATLPKGLVGDCRKICRMLGRELAGVDAIPHGDGYAFLEVNAIPQLTSGAFVDTKMQVLASTVEAFINSNQKDARP